MVKSVFTGRYEYLLSILISERKSARMTQQELAAHLGKTQSFVSKYERGERRLDVVEFIAVAEAIGVDPQNIIQSVLTYPTGGSIE